MTNVYHRNGRPMKTSISNLTHLHRSAPQLACGHDYCISALAIKLDAQAGKFRPTMDLIYSDSDSDSLFCNNMKTFI